MSGRRKNKLSRIEEIHETRAEVYTMSGVWSNRELQAMSAVMTSGETHIWSL